MRVKLPEAVTGSGITKRGNVSFGGYNHNLYAGDGELWDMENLTSDLAPLLAPMAAKLFRESVTVPTISSPA